MEDTMNVVGHLGFTWGAYLMSHWTEIGAAVLMLLQGTLLVMKLIDGYKKRYRGPDSVGSKDSE